MAEDKNSIAPGLEYATKMPAVGRSAEDQQANIDAAKAGLDALEARYQNPNWFNVAAGFLKPQLGGFAASLGSAAEALGANTEQQRANQIPIYNARAQLAYMQAQQGNKQKAAELFQALGDKPMDDKTYRSIIALAPNSEIADAAKAAYEGQQKERTLSASEQANAMQRVQYARQNKLPVNPADLELISAGSPTRPQAPTTAAPANAPAFNFDLGKNNANLPAITEAIKAMPPEDQAAATDHLDKLLTGASTPTTAVRGEAKPGFEDLGLNPEQARAQSAENVAATEKASHPDVQAINTFSPPHVKATMRVIDPLSELLTDPEVKKGLGLLYGEPGLKQAFMSAAAKGAQVAIGNSHVGVSIPFEDYLKNMDVSKEGREKLRKVQSLLGQLQASTVRQAAADVGGRLAVPEFQNVMTNVFSTSDPASVLQQLVATEALRHQQGLDVYKHFHGSYLKNAENRNAPMANYFLDPEYQKIIDSYDDKFARASRIGQTPKVKP